ncbi:hypothetical protein BU23DRAFT_548411 [Bimuria novae-zelandiae CBS 107.79]|uniref:Uncharacterized protein n=1 Tax=Bimuria novae-zelandiae CBS 107.79 TaxID=1447943 RepID=A0A6A5VTJ3_9PLEO|nr:hypothetical protein BU23DRAFT_548411 [Bimuria novae-zelandiae CBS 107.79]
MTARRNCLALIATCVYAQAASQDRKRIRRDVESTKPNRPDGFRWIGENSRIERKMGVGSEMTLAPIQNRCNAVPR